MFSSDLREGVSRLDDDVDQVERSQLRYYLRCREPDLARLVPEHSGVDRCLADVFAVRNGDLHDVFVPVDRTLFIEVLDVSCRDLPLLW